MWVHKRIQVIYLIFTAPRASKSGRLTPEMATKTARLWSPTGTIENQVNYLKLLVHSHFVSKKLNAHWHLDTKKISLGLPLHHQEQPTQTLIVCLLKTHFCFWLWKLEGPRPSSAPPPVPPPCFKQGSRLNFWPHLSGHRHGWETNHPSGNRVGWDQGSSRVRHAVGQKVFGHTTSISTCKASQHATHR